MFAWAALFDRGSGGVANEEKLRGAASHPWRGGRGRGGRGGEAPAPVVVAMGNTNVRDGVRAPAGGQQQHHQGSGGGYIVPGQGQGQQQRDLGRLGHVASAESMGQSPSDSPGSAARSPLMFTPQVGFLGLRNRGLLHVTPICDRIIRVCGRSVEIGLRWGEEVSMRVCEVSGLWFAGLSLYRL